MGNKNARRNPALTPTRGPMGQGSSSTQVMDASPVSVVTNSPKSKATSEASSKAGGQPTALPFRSYQTGTLHTNNFAPSGSAPKKVPDIKNGLSAQSPAFIPSNKAGRKYSEPSPTISRLLALIASMPKFDPYVDLAITDPHNNSDVTITSPSGQSATTWVDGWGIEQGSEVPRPADYIGEFHTRADRSKKDIVITYSSITHNIVRIMEFCFPGGKPFFQSTLDYHPDCYNFEDINDKMFDYQRIAFWESNWVEIIVDLGDFNPVPGDEDKSVKDITYELRKKKTGTVEIMNDLGNEFPDHTRTVIVTILFPKDASPRVGNNVKSCTKEQQESAGFQAVQNIANKLKEFLSLTRLEIVLRTPAHAHPPISLEQLNFALPFYELPFTKWQLKWQNTYMSRPEIVRGWPITYLDIERSKINRDIEKARREDELALHNAVFVRPSASPGVHILPFVARVEADNAANAARIEAAHIEKATRVEKPKPL